MIQWEKCEEIQIHCFESKSKSYFHLKWCIKFQFELLRGDFMLHQILPTKNQSEQEIESNA